MNIYNRPSQKGVTDEEESQSPPEKKKLSKRSSRGLSVKEPLAQSLFCYCPDRRTRNINTPHSLKTTRSVSNMSYHFSSWGVWGGVKKKKEEDEEEEKNIVRTAPSRQFITVSKYNCRAGLGSSAPFINPNLRLSGTTPRSSCLRADPAGLLLADKWIDPPVQDLRRSGTYKLQRFPPRVNVHACSFCLRWPRRHGSREIWHPCNALICVRVFLFCFFYCRKESAVLNQSTSSTFLSLVCVSVWVNIVESNFLKLLHNT